MRSAALGLRLAAALGLALGGLAACAGGDGPETCRIRVLGVERFESVPRGVDIAYRVQGEAGSSAVASLVAKIGPRNFITGTGVEVGPGPFQAVVELKLTGRPPELMALLEVGPRKRCRASVP